MDLRGKVKSRGLRNNNPFNLVKTSILWKGKVPGDDPKFETFSSVEYGLRAGMMDILGDINTGQDTFSLLIGGTPPLFLDGFAPAGDGNDVDFYVSYLADFVGFPKTGNLKNLTKVQFLELARGIVFMENRKEDAELLLPSVYSASYDLLPPESKYLRVAFDEKSVTKFRFLSFFLFSFFVFFLYVRFR